MPNAGDLLPVVGIGASAGGLEALTKLFSAMSADTGMAFVVVQHLDPQHESRLRELLATTTGMPVLEATEGLAVQAGHIYVIAPNTTLTIAERTCRIKARSETPGVHLPIDSFLQSLAEDERVRPIGVILSGTGTDGTRGLEAIKAAGGITIAQDEQSAAHTGMPLTAIRSGCVDAVLAPGDIAKELARIAHHPYLMPGTSLSATVNAQADDDGYGDILRQLRGAYKVDFSNYRDTTLKRRIARRMVLRSMGRLTDYAVLLEGDAAELDALYHDILINVTSFFRDPEVFEVIKRDILPVILRSKAPGAPIRFWVPGCSTGQEAYSLAMATTEFFEEANLPAPSLQIFASDLSERMALKQARDGLYPESIEAELSAERLRRFFTREDSHYRVSESLRDMVVFARQDVTADPPFSRVDLISCRNLLIYLAPALQKRVIPTFHYALNPGGFLVLGSSETVGSFSALFGAAEQGHRIYVKKTATIRTYPSFFPGQTVASAGQNRAVAATAVSATDWQREADRVALARYAPPGVLVNEGLEILQFRGQTGPFLTPAPGEPTLNLLKMAREGLFVALRAALTEAQQEGVPVHREGVHIRGEGGSRKIALHVMPLKLPQTAERCYVVSFEESSQSPASPSPSITSAPPLLPAGEIEVLTQELVSTREYLQSVIEQQDVANEELKASNEEILSSNEELQSTNEELETAKEELQSLNEELTTVNEQLQVRNAELTRLNDDMVNILSSVNVPIIVFGVDLRVRRFTPPATKVLNIRSSDIGRPVSHLRPPIAAVGLEAMLTEVIETVQVRELEVESEDGHWYALRVLPYRTTDNRIDGAVLALEDIHTAKVTQAALRDSRDYARAIIETARDPLLVLDRALRIQLANRAFYRTFGLTAHETVGRLLYELSNRRWDIEELRALLAQVLEGSNTLEDYQVEARFDEIDAKVLLVNARRIRRNGEDTELILLALEDATARTRSGDAQRRLAEIVECSDDAIVSTTLEGNVTTWNAGAEHMFGFTAREAIGTDLTVLLRTSPLEEAEVLERLRSGERVAHFETTCSTKEGRKLHLSVAVSPLRNASGEVTGVSRVARDISDSKRMREELRAFADGLAEADKRKDEFLAMLAHELRNPLAPIRNALEILRQAGPVVPAEHAAERAAVEMMQRQVAQMVRLIDELLDVSRGRIELQRGRVDLKSIVYHAAQVAQGECDAMHQRLDVTLAQEPVFVDGDPVRLVQVIGNLLSNASKFTEGGGRIEVLLSQENGFALLVVRDNGIGIPTEQLPRIFDMFAQADSSLERTRSGLGIGLTLVKTLLEMHGGTVVARSPGAGQGSEFIVRLPLLSPEQSAEPPAPERLERQSTPTHGLRILIVDDNRDSADSLAMLLQWRGHEIHTAYDGLQAVADAATLQPDVILLDIGLPGLNGMDAARRIRENRSDSSFLLVALTGWGQADDRRRSLDAGFDAHLVKPVAIEDLDALIAKLPAKD